jgi:hypothetical protein
MKETEEQNGLSPVVRFLYGNHTVENLDAIWDETKDADIVLIEWVGHTEGLLEKVIPSLDEDTFESKFLARTLKDNKEVHLIDSPAGESAEEEANTGTKLFNDCLDSIDRGRLSVAFGFFRTSVLKTILANKHREDYTIDQVEKLIEENKEKWQGKMIVVIQGAEHTRVYHSLKKNYPTVRRAFPQSPYIYSLYSELVRKKLFFPEVPLEYTKAFLSLIVSSALSDMGVSRDEADKKASRIVRQLPQEKVNEYGAAILKADEHKEGFEFIAQLIDEFEI